MVTETERAGTCPGPEPLAEFIEGRLQGASRAAMVAHLAECERCRKVFAQLARESNVLPFWKRTDVRTGAGVLALAASLIVVAQVRPDLNPFREPTPYEELVAIVGSKRLIEPRLTGGFAYGPLESPTRGETGPADVRLRAEVGVLRERVAETKAAPALHAFGAGQLLIGDSPGAIDTLRRAVQLAPDDPAVNADLAAALAVVALQNGRRQDTDGALAALDVAIALDPKLPEAWFNKALLLESDRRPAEAAAAWEVFLSLDSTSAWAEYARARRAKLGHRELP